MLSLVLSLKISTKYFDIVEHKWRIPAFFSLWCSPRFSSGIRPGAHSRASGALSDALPEARSIYFDIA